MIEFAIGASLSLRRNTVTRLSSQTEIFTTTVWWILLAALSVLCTLRMIETVKRRGHNLWTRVDVNWVDKANSESNRSYGIRVLTGRALWAAHFLWVKNSFSAKLVSATSDIRLSSGEPKWMIISRGIFAVIFVLGIGVIALFNIVLDPVRESALTPVKEVRSPDLPYDFKMTVPTVWNVVLVRFERII